MKKYLFMAIAAAAMTGCSQDESLDVAQKEAISFKDAFVENATRAAIDGSYTNAKGNLASFQVYATTKDNASASAVNIFNGVTVSGTQGTDGKYTTPWSYDAAYTQYWIEGNYYKFIAIADGNTHTTGSNGTDQISATKVNLDATNMPISIQVDNAAIQKDVLYAENNMGEYTKDADDETVAFTFNHIFSKAKFTAKVVDELDSKYYYLVKNIKIKGAALASTYTINGGTWSTATNTYDVDFGNIVTDPTTSTEASQLAAKANVESHYDRLLIPETNVNIEFDVELHTANGLINSYTETISNLEVKMDSGKAYNFVFTLPVPGDKIEFTVTTITEWVDTDKNLN